MAQSFPVLGDLRCSPVTVARVRSEHSESGPELECRSTSTPGSDAHDTLESDVVAAISELVCGLSSRSYTPTELAAELQTVEALCARALHSEPELSPSYLASLLDQLQRCDRRCCACLQQRSCATPGFAGACAKRAVAVCRR